MYIAPRENGIWYVYFGRAKKRSLKTKEEAVAKRRFKGMEQELLKGKLIIFGGGQDSTMMLSELLTEYRKWGVDYLAEESIEIVDLRSHHFMTAVGDKYISSITARDMGTFITYLKTRKNQNTTINIGIRTMKAIFSWATDKERKYLKEDPFKGCKQLKVVKRVYDIVDGPDQVKKLFEIVGDNRRWRIIMALYVYTGGRRKDIHRLLWADVRDDVVIYRDAKDGEDREVPIAGPLKAIFAEYDFKNRIGRVVDVGIDQLSKGIKHYLKQAGLEKMRPHDLRHSFASHLLMEGVDVGTVAKMLGHSSPVTTSNIYTKVLKRHVKESIKKLPY